MKLRGCNSIRPASLLFVCLSLGIKALIPLGYMPAAIGDGWPIKACHDGLRRGLLVNDDARHAATGEDLDARWENCPFGALSISFGIETEYQIDFGKFAKDLRPLSDAPAVETARPIVFWSRAPPAATH